jgi:hypothetical protein
LETLPALPSQFNPGYELTCVACLVAYLSGKRLTLEEQSKLLGCGGNYTANYRLCIKWKGVRATGAKGARPVRWRLHALIASKWDPAKLSPKH